MYSYVKSVCLAKTLEAQWQEVDLSNVIVSDIYNTYSKVYLELSNPALQNDVYVDFDSLKNEFINYNDTLIELLSYLGNRTLDTISALPSATIKFAKYSDAFRSNYKIETCKIGYVLPDNYPEIEKKDLVITRPNYNTDMSLIDSHCLVTVNGFVHDTTTDGSATYVHNGATTMRKTNNNHLGILSFLDIGELTKVKIDPNRITGQGNGSSLKDRIYFSIDQDLTNKSYFLVLGGYIIFPHENTFWRSGDKVFALNLLNTPYVEKIFESDLYMDMSSLGITRDPINPHMFSTEELLSDQTIINYMTMSQSFLVIVDIPVLINRKLNIRSCNMPGMFTSYIDPIYPLFVNYGKMVEYWKTFEDGFWSVTVQDSFFRNYVISEQPYADIPNVNNNLIPNKPFRNSRGFMLEISGYTI